MKPNDKTALDYAKMGAGGQKDRPLFGILGPGHWLVRRCHQGTISKEVAPKIEVLERPHL
jgi:hypothetical protein